MNERARGALLGLAVGDALGTTYEFARIQQPAYPTLATAPATDVVGDGPFGLPPGAITDDTQLAVCLARSLADKGGFDAADVAARYVAWQSEAFDIGNQTRSALWHTEKTESTEGGMLAWRESGHHAAGNGSLMRTTPIAVALGARGVAAVIDAAMADSLLTHADPRCVLACAAHDAAIATVIAEGGDGRAMVASARAALETGARRLHALWKGEPEVELIAAAKAVLESDLERALASDPDLYGEELHIHQTAGYVRVAFRLAFWHAVHTPTWKAALVDVASRGGDSDTNGAIVGALLGARDGASAIPAAWVERVLAARQPGSDEWAEAHHPKHLLALE